MTLKTSIVPLTIYDLIKVADFHFLLEPRHTVNRSKVSFNKTVKIYDTTVKVRP